MKNKVLLTALMLIMCFSLLISIPPMAHAENPPVCTINETPYYSLDEALAAYSGGDTINLLKDIDYTTKNADGVYIYYRNLTFNLDGYTLNILNTNDPLGTGMTVVGAELKLIDTSAGKTGALNIDSIYNGINVYNGGKATITNVDANNGAYPVMACGSAGDNNKITILGDVIGFQHGVYTSGDSTIHVKGNITHTGLGGEAIYCTTGSSVTVDGDITVGGYGVWAKDGGTIHIKGDITQPPSSSSTAAVYADNNCSVIVDGDITTRHMGVKAWNSVVIINGNINAEGSSSYVVYGITASTNSLVTVNGNILNPNTINVSPTYVKAGLRLFERTDGKIGEGDDSGYMVYEYGDDGPLIYENGGTKVRVFDLPVPRITTQPSNTTFTYGQIDGKLMVEAAAEEEGTLSYQWYKNTTNNYCGGEAIVGATSNEYTLPTHLNAGEYYYYVIVANTKNTKTSSRTSAVAKITIEKATPIYTTPTGLEAKEGESLGDLTLPTGFTWEDDASTLVGAEGENTFKTIFSPEDSNNYNSVPGINVVIKVIKTDPSTEPDTEDADIVEDDTLTPITQDKVDDNKITPTTEEKVEIKKTLPKTGEMASSIFYLSGAMVTGLGWVLLKKRRSN